MLGVVFGLEVLGTRGAGQVFVAECLGRGVWGLGFEVWGLGFGFGGLGFGVGGLSLGVCG